MKIAIASGKGGTGKTMVAANLGFTLALSREAALVDCDVESRTSTSSSRRRRSPPGDDTGPGDRPRPLHPLR